LDIDILERRGEVMVKVDSLDEPFNFDVKKSKFDKNELLLTGCCVVVVVAVDDVDSDLIESLID
jgi:hypothetical protein